MLVLGIDDAGRGPVIGDMVMAGCLTDEEMEKEFKKAGVKDSKQLTRQKRDQLAVLVKEKAIATEIVQISPDEIDTRTNAGVNLNHLEAIKMAQIINTINKKTEKIKVYVDCPSPNIPPWRELLKHYVEHLDNLEIICEHKADIKFPCVSAASILAKNRRDSEIDKLKKKVGVDFGSGYSHDPATCKFLKEYFDKHKDDGIFRKTWQTWKNACSEKEQKKLEL